jgi:hypothetical protein
MRSLEVRSVPTTCRAPLVVPVDVVSLDIQPQVIDVILSPREPDAARRSSQIDLNGNIRAGCSADADQIVLQTDSGLSNRGSPRALSANCSACGAVLHLWTTLADEVLRCVPAGRMPL